MEESKKLKILSKTFLEGLNDLLDITTRMLGAYDLKSLLQHILQVSLEVSGGNTGSLMLLDEKTNTLAIKAAVGLDENIVKTKKIKFGDEIAGWVAKNSEGLLLKGDLSTDLRFYKFSKKDRIVSAMCVPLKIESKAIGVLNINSLDAKIQFTDDDLKFISVLANQASISIWHVRLYEELKRTHQEYLLARNQLIASEKLASLGQLAAGVAHEMNNPLAIMSANIQYLISKTANADPRMFEMAEIKNAYERCVKIVDRLLRYSRPHADKGSAVDVNGIIKEVLGLAEYQTSLQDVKIVLGLEYDLSKPRIDPDELKEVFLNIVLNAKDAMPNGGSLTIKTSNIDDKGVMIEFTDTGTGILKEDMDKIFDPFFTTKQAKGTGLGLSICQRIITEYKGTIEVDSRPGKGTTITVKLPIL